jgi:hypothetical protein
MKRRNKTKPVRAGNPATTSKSHLSAGDVQESSGGLKESQNQVTGQKLSGAFNPTHRVNIEEIDISVIQPFRLIPDYTRNTESLLPIVAVSSASVHCLDGWELIEKQVSESKDKIRCLVYHLKHCSDLEIAIQKVAIRTMPQGGTCSYAELVRNAGILFKMLMTSTDNPVVFSHGGSRRGPSYAENKENNIRTLLANRLGKSTVAVNKYLNHGEFINDETMQELINADVEKGFFEAIQVHKRSLIARLKVDQIPDDDITDDVSQLVLSLLNEYRQAEPVEISCDEIGQDEASPVETQAQPTGASAPAPGIEEFKHWSGIEITDNDATVTEEDISQKIKTVGALLIQTADNTELTIQQQIETYTRQNLELSRLIQQLIHLMNQPGIKGEDRN